MFARVVPRDHEDLLALARVEWVAMSRIVFRAGEPSTHVYLLERMYGLPCLVIAALRRR